MDLSQTPHGNQQPKENASQRAIVLTAQQLAAYQAVDQRLAAIGKPLLLTSQISPSDEDWKKERDAFLADRSYEPRFVYQPLTCNPVQLRAELQSVDVPPDVPALASLFEEKKVDLRASLRILEHRGDKDVVRDTSVGRFGAPSAELVVKAIEAVEKAPPTPPRTPCTMQELVDEIEGMFRKLGLVDWKISFDEVWNTRCAAEPREIRICRNRNFTLEEAKRLAVHEVGVHALRAENGFEQPLRIFGKGLPGYLETEEGLAAYAEIKAGVSDPKIIRNYAGRVLAVDSMVKDQSFRECFERLDRLGFDALEAVELTRRAYRGGGFAKDHLYFQGLFKVSKYLADGGDINPLLVGKVAIEHLPIVTDLLNQGILLPPKIRPLWVK